MEENAAYSVQSAFMDATRLVIDGRLLTPGPGWPMSAPMTIVYGGTMVGMSGVVVSTAEFTPPILPLILQECEQGGSLA